MQTAPRTAARRRATRSLRLLMAQAAIPTFGELADVAGVGRNQITLVAQGWRGTDTVRASLAKALRCKPADILAAARAAHLEAS